MHRPMNIKNIIHYLPHPHYLPGTSPYTFRHCNNTTWPSFFSAILWTAHLSSPIIFQRSFSDNFQFIAPLTLSIRSYHILAWWHKAEEQIILHTKQLSTFVFSVNHLRFLKQKSSEVTKSVEEIEEKQRNWKKIIWKQRKETAFRN